MDEQTTKETPQAGSLGREDEEEEEELSDAEILEMEEQTVDESQLVDVAVNVALANVDAEGIAEPGVTQQDGGDGPAADDQPATVASEDQIDVPPATDEDVAQEDEPSHTDILIAAMVEDVDERVEYPDEDHADVEEVEYELTREESASPIAPYAVPGTGWLMLLN